MAIKTLWKVYCWNTGTVMNTSKNKTKARDEVSGNYEDEDS